MSDTTITVRLCLYQGFWSNGRVAYASIPDPRTAGADVDCFNTLCDKTRAAFALPYDGFDLSYSWVDKRGDTIAIRSRHDLLMIRNMHLKQLDIHVMSSSSSSSRSRTRDMFTPSTKSQLHVKDVMFLLSLMLIGLGVGFGSNWAITIWAIGMFLNTAAFNMQWYQQPQRAVTKKEAPPAKFKYETELKQMIEYGFNAGHSCLALINTKGDMNMAIEQTARWCAK